MADSSSPFALNVLGVTDLVQNPTNKVENGIGTDEGIESEKFDALALNMKDEDLLKLRDEWEKRYATYEKKHNDIVRKNLESYLGKRPDGQWLAGDDVIAGNLQFEAEETFLAAALAKNPEPIVWADNTPEGNTLAGDVKTMLQFHADQLVIRRVLTLAVRQWSINHLASIKAGWDRRVDDVLIENRKVRDFIFDPTGYVDAYGDFTSYLGERITVTAEKLVELYPKHKAYIETLTESKLGTDVTYTEWWTDEYCFVTFKTIVLDKFKNPYFKYAEPMQDGMGQPIPDEMGQPMMSEPRNHFAYPKKPYIFLSVYSLQEQPHDITGLVEQNIPNQNLIAKRIGQIDKNISSSNNGYAYSGDNFNEETARQAATAREKGNPIIVPSGASIDRAIMRLDAADLPSSVFNELEINKNSLRTSWGVQGITAEPQDEDQTARGMILNQSHDTSRIGGGIGDAVEQVADNIFNWLTQLYYVFYDEEHFAAIMGGAKAVEYVTLSNAQFDRQLIVSVSPDSLRPRDEVTEINLAQALFDKGAIGSKTLLKMLNFPNPDEAAADGLLYKLDPMGYMMLNFPEYAQRLQEAQQVQAQQQMVNQAQATGMNTAAQAAATPPEGANGEPEQNISRPPTSASLGNVPIT